MSRRGAPPGQGAFRRCGDRRAIARWWTGLGNITEGFGRERSRGFRDSASVIEIGRGHDHLPTQRMYACATATSEHSAARQTMAQRLSLIWQRARAVSAYTARTIRSCSSGGGSGCASVDTGCGAGGVHPVDRVLFAFMNDPCLLSINTDITEIAPGCLGVYQMRFAGMYYA